VSSDRYFINMTINIYTFMLSSILILLWVGYMTNRALLGFSPISDEVFYINSNIADQSKRIYFLSFVQFFSSFYNAVIAVAFVNIALLVISFKLLIRINCNNHTASFFHLIYFCAIAAYLFRDTIILFLVVSIIYLIFERRYIQRVRINLSGLGGVSAIVLLLLLLIDFRPQYFYFILISFVLAKIATKLSNLALVVFSVLILSVVLFVIENILNSFSIYGISLYEFIGTRVDKNSMDISPFSLSVSYIKHFFAPLPTSLIERFIYEGNLAVYYAIDDIYRLVYKTFIYIISIYIVINISKLKFVLNRWRGEFFFLLSFSLLNSFMYTMFLFGGGHERTKVFSVFFIVFLFCAISKIKNEVSDELSVG